MSSTTPLPLPPLAVRRRRTALAGEERIEQLEMRRLRRDLAAAVAQERFELYYHPRIALADGHLVGAEALIRWPHRRRGLIQAGAFIPLAEEAGLIGTIGAWVLRTACATATGWGGRARVSVNVAMGQLAEDQLLFQVADALERSALSPELLEIEVSESVLVRCSTDALLALGAIRDLGVTVTLDDFGTAYGSLAMLKQLPIDYLKLDRSLVRTLPEDLEDMAIAQAVIDTGHALGVAVVAEGVETEAQRTALAAMGCDEAQGYLFSLPMTAAQFRQRMLN